MRRSDPDPASGNEAGTEVVGDPVAGRIVAAGVGVEVARGEDEAGAATGLLSKVLLIKSGMFNFTFDRGRRSRSREDRRSRRRSGSRDRRDRSRDRRVEARLGSPTRRGGGDREKGRSTQSPARGMGNVHSEFHIRNVRSASPEQPLTPEERDGRTIFCMQLSQRVRARDVEDFFSSVGKVRDVKLIVCNKTRRFKGIAYVEFKDLESVPLALGLSGQKLCGKSPIEGPPLEL